MPPAPRWPGTRSSPSFRMRRLSLAGGAQGGRSASGPRRCLSPTRKTPASTTRTSRSLSTWCTPRAGCASTTRPMPTASWASPGPATPVLTCATSTCTRPSPPRTAAADRRWAPPGSTRRWRHSCPLPTVEFNGESYFLDYDRPQSIGKIRPFYGVAPVVLNAYAWVMSLGADGLREVAEIAVLNNNYLLQQMLEIRGVSAPYAAGQAPGGAGALLHGRHLPGYRGAHRGYRSAGGGFRHALLVQPPPVDRAQSGHPGADRELFAGGYLDEFAGILKHISDEAYSTPGDCQDGAAQQHHPPHRPPPVGRPGCLGGDLAGVQTQAGRAPGKEGKAG